MIKLGVFNRTKTGQKNSFLKQSPFNYHYYKNSNNFLIKSDLLKNFHSSTKTPIIANLNNNNNNMREGQGQGQQRQRQCQCQGQGKNEKFHQNQAQRRQQQHERYNERIRLPSVISKDIVYMNDYWNSFIYENKDPRHQHQAKHQQDCKNLNEKFAKMLFNDLASKPAPTLQDSLNLRGSRSQDFFEFKDFIQKAKDKKLSGLVYDTFQKDKGTFAPEWNSIYDDDDSSPNMRSCGSGRKGKSFGDNFCWKESQFRNDFINFMTSTELDLNVLEEILVKKEPLTDHQIKFLERFLKMIDTLDMRNVQFLLNFMKISSSNASPLNHYLKSLLVSRHQKITIDQKKKEIEEVYNILQNQLILKEMIEPSLRNVKDKKVFNNTFNKLLSSYFLINESQQNPEPAQEESKEWRATISSKPKYQKLILLNSLLTEDDKKANNSNIFQFYLKELGDLAPFLDYQLLGKEMQVMIDANILKPFQVKLMYNLLKEKAEDWKWSVLVNVYKVFERSMHLMVYSFKDFNILKPSELKCLLDMALKDETMLPSEQYILQNFIDGFKNVSLEKTKDYLSLLKANGLLDSENESLLRQYLKRRGIALPELNNFDTPKSELQKYMPIISKEKENMQFFLDPKNVREFWLNHRVGQNFPVDYTKLLQAIYKKVQRANQLSYRLKKQDLNSPTRKIKRDLKAIGKLEKSKFSCRLREALMQQKIQTEKRRSALTKKPSINEEASVISLAFQCIENFCYRNKILKGLNDIQRLALLKVNQLFNI